MPLNPNFSLPGLMTPRDTVDYSAHGRLTVPLPLTDVHSFLVRVLSPEGSITHQQLVSSELDIAEAFEALGFEGLPEVVDFDEETTIKLQPYTTSMVFYLGDSFLECGGLPLTYEDEELVPVLDIVCDPGSRTVKVYALLEGTLTEYNWGVSHAG
jgi:hypothetical protein